jgi:hypothetical protein
MTLYDQAQFMGICQIGELVSKVIMHNAVCIESYKYDGHKTSLLPTLH